MIYDKFEKSFTTRELTGISVPTIASLKRYPDRLSPESTNILTKRITLFYKVLTDKGLSWDILSGRTIPISDLFANLVLRIQDGYVPFDIASAYLRARPFPHAPKYRGTPRQ